MPLARAAMDAVTLALPRLHMREGLLEVCGWVEGGGEAWWRGARGCGARAARAGALDLSPPDWPAALAHYYFAAAGNDTLAQMALGARHAAGLGVPK